MDAFMAAAAAVAERREEATLPTEDRIMKHMTRWCEAWRQDLEHRPSEVAESPAGAESPHGPDLYNRIYKLWGSRVQ